MTTTVLFVCSANICRSPMAEGLFRKMIVDKGIMDNIVVMSAGLSKINGEPPSENAIAVMHERGIDISQHCSQQITREMAGKATIIVVMAGHHKVSIAALFPECRGKTRLLSELAEGKDVDIPDPIGMGIEKYRQVADLLKRFLKGLVAKV